MTGTSGGGITFDLVSVEEAGSFEGVSGWIVRPPSFRSQGLVHLCATLRAKLESNPKYTAAHHRHFQTGEPLKNARMRLRQQKYISRVI